MFGSRLGWKVPLPLLAARRVKFRVTSLYNKMDAAPVVLSNNMSQLHFISKYLVADDLGLNLRGVAGEENCVIVLYYMYDHVTSVVP